MLDEASMSKNIVLFIDEIHQAMGAGASSKDDVSVSEILKPYLDYGKIRVIGATTKEEYTKYIKPSAAFNRRFARIDIEKPTTADIYLIVDDLITSYNALSERKNLELGKKEFPVLPLSEEEKDELIKCLIRITSHVKYDDTINNPALVIEIVEKAYALARKNCRKYVTLEDFSTAVISEKRIPNYDKQREINQLLEIKPQEKEDKIIQLESVKKLVKH